MCHVLVFAKTPYDRTPFDRWLAGTGFTPIVLTPTDYLPGYAHLPHVYGFEDYDTNQLVEKTALRLACDLSVRAVFARAEADIVRAAQLRELLGLPGQWTDSALAFRDKVVMKDHLVAGPVELPSYRRLDSAYTALDFIATHGYPVVIKPVSESGSLGAVVIRDEEALDAYLARPWRGRSEIETFVPGQMYHVDGLVVDGEVRFIHPFRYLNDCLSFREDGWVANVPLALDDPLQDRLVNAARALLEWLPTPRHTAFHAELWITPDDRIVFCEIASRTGGGMISYLVRHAFGLDLDRLWLLAECGLPVQLPEVVRRPAGALCIPPSRGVLESLPRSGEPDSILEASITGRVGQRFNGGVKSGLFLAGYVVGGQDEHDVEANLEKVADWFQASTVWRPVTEGERT